MADTPANQLNGLLKKTYLAKDEKTLEEIRSLLTEFIAKSGTLTAEETKKLEHLKNLIVETNSKTAFVIQRKLQVMMDKAQIQYLDMKMNIKDNAEKSRDNIKQDLVDTAKDIKADIESTGQDISLAFLDINRNYEETKKETRLLMDSKFKEFGEFFEKRINLAATFVSNTITATSKATWNFISNRIGYLYNNLGSMIRSGFTNLKNSIFHPIDSLKSMPKNIIKGITSIITNAVSSIKKFVVGMFKMAYHVIAGVVKFSFMVIGKILKGIGWFIGKVFQGIYFVVQKLFSFVYKIATKILSFVIGVIWGAIKAIGQFLATVVWDSLKLIGMTIFRIGAYIFNTLINVIAIVVGEALAPILLIVTAIAVIGFLLFIGFKKLWDIIGNFFGETASGTALFFNKFILKPLETFFKNLFNETTELGKGFWRLLQKSGQWIVDSILGKNLEGVQKEKEFYTGTDQKTSAGSEFLYKSEQDVINAKADLDKIRTEFQEKSKTGNGSKEDQDKINDLAINLKNQQDIFNKANENLLSMQEEANKKLTELNKNTATLTDPANKRDRVGGVAYAILDKLFPGHENESFSDIFKDVYKFIGDQIDTLLKKFYNVIFGGDTINWETSSGLIGKFKEIMYVDDVNPIVTFIKNSLTPFITEVFSALSSILGYFSPEAANTVQAAGRSVTNAIGSGVTTISKSGAALLTERKTSALEELESPNLTPQRKNALTEQIANLGTALGVARSNQIEAFSVPDQNKQGIQLNLAQELVKSARYLQTLGENDPNSYAEWIVNAQTKRKGLRGIIGQIIDPTLLKGQYTLEDGYAFGYLQPENKAIFNAILNDKEQFTPANVGTFKSSLNEAFNNGYINDKFRKTFETILSSILGYQSSIKGAYKKELTDEQYARRNMHMDEKTYENNIKGSILDNLISEELEGALSVSPSLAYANLIRLEGYAQNSVDSAFGFAQGGIIKPIDMGRNITVAEAGNPEIVLPLSAEGLNYIKQMSDKINPEESSKNSEQMGEVVKAINDMSDKIDSINNKPGSRLPFMPAMNIKDSPKLDITKMVSMGYLSK